jgi:integrase/recombinase XerD
MNKPEYQFTGEIKQQVESFRNYLQKQYIDKNTIRQKTNYAGYFLNWLETEHLQPEQTRYNDLLNFIDYCRLENKSKAHVNRIIASIREYYKFLRIENPGIINPAMGLYLKGTRRKIVSGIIAFEELETLYQSFETTTNRQKRNKVILGLFIYQAISTEELSKLEPGHVKLKEGKIYIPGNRRRNSRILELEPFQILELHEYLTEIRPKILNEITVPKPARKPDKINKTRIKEQLFVSINGSENIKNSLLHLFRDVQKINPNITNAKQIRQSTITHWLKNHNLRQVQYMAGHKYVSSTERYQTNNLDNLQSKLEKYHPLNHN